MESWFRLPLVVRVALIITAWFSYAIAILALNAPDSSSRVAMPVGVGCLLGAWVTVGVDLGVHRKFGSREQTIAYQRALRTGDLPADAEPDKWRRWLRGSRWSTAFAVMWIVPALWFGWMSSITSPSVYRWMPASVFALLAAWGLVSVCRRGARIRRLTDEVKRRRASLDQAAASPASATPALSLQQSAFEASTAGRLVPIALGGFVLAFLILLVADLEYLVYGGPRVLGLRWAAGCAAAFGFTLAALVIERNLRRDFASYEEYTEYNQTLRTGRLPAAIEPDAWRRRLRSSRRENLIRPMLAGFLVAVGIASIATRQSVYHWVTASLFQLLAMWLLVKWWEWRDRLVSLTAEVERHDARQSWG